MDCNGDDVGGASWYGDGGVGENDVDEGSEVDEASEQESSGQSEDDELGDVDPPRRGRRGTPGPRRRGARAPSPRLCHGDATAAERRRAPDGEWYTFGEFEEFFDDPEGHVWRRCTTEAGSKALAEEWYAERQALEAKLQHL